MKELGTLHSRYSIRPRLEQVRQTGHLSSLILNLLRPEFNAKLFLREIMKSSYLGVRIINLFRLARSFLSTLTVWSAKQSTRPRMMMRYTFFLTHWSLSMQKLSLRTNTLVNWVCSIGQAILLTRYLCPSFLRCPNLKHLRSSKNQLRLKTQTTTATKVSKRCGVQRALSGHKG